MVYFEIQFPLDSQMDIPRIVKNKYPNYNNWLTKNLKIRGELNKQMQQLCHRFERKGEKGKKKEWKKLKRKETSIKLWFLS